jgi:hypothetical protein
LTHLDGDTGSELVRFFVNGQAMSGGALHGPLAEHGRALGQITTAPRYRFWAWNDEFPALQPVSSAGWRVPGELYLLDYSVLRDLVLPSEPPQLELGVIELADGRGAMAMQLRAGIPAGSPELRAIPAGSGWRSYQLSRSSGRHPDVAV